MNIIIFSHHSLMNGWWCRLLHRPNDSGGFLSESNWTKGPFHFRCFTKILSLPTLDVFNREFLCIDFIIHTVFMERQKWNKSSERSFCLISGAIVLDFNFDLFYQKNTNTQTASCKYKTYWQNIFTVQSVHKYWVPGKNMNIDMNGFSVETHHKM